MTDMKDIKKKSDADLSSFITDEREKVRAERFKDKFTKKAGTIRAAKKNVARALTEVNARRRTPNAK